MSLKVKVVGTSDNKVITQNPKKPDYGSIRFDQRRFAYKGNFLSMKNHVNFTAGKMEELEEFVKIMELTPGKELSGNVYTIERREPFYEGQEPKINPSTGHIVLVDGLPVYRNSYYDPSGTKFDDLIMGVNSVGPQLKAPVLAENLEAGMLASSKLQ